MYLTFLQFILFSLATSQAKSYKKCDVSYCNYEAECLITAQGSTCECVGSFFEGKRCSDPVDHCVSNPCSNGGTCRSYLGHYNCECAEGFSGQTCSSKLNTVKGLHIHYNHIAPVGKEQVFMLTMQSIGSAWVLLELYMPDSILDGISFSQSNRYFKMSSKLKVVSSNLGIRHSYKLPYTKGFYRILRTTFWSLGLHSMTLDLTEYESGVEKLFTRQFDIFVYDPSGSLCLPVIHLPSCENPRNALHMDIVTFNFVEPIVDKRCSKGSSFKYKWTVWNYIRTVQLHRFPENALPMLTIPPYTMWFDFSDDYLQSYLIEGAVTEMINGHVLSSTVVKCYVFIDSKYVMSHILGGEYREVDVSRGFTVDGSPSRDYATHPDAPQKLRYFWSCLSEDSQNNYCPDFLDNERSISIPARALKEGVAYNFSLGVRSLINIYSTDRTTQVVKPISGQTLLLDFLCLRNCDHNRFAAGKVLHLKVQCIKCPPGKVAYVISDEKGIELSTSHSVVLTDTSKEVIVLKAEGTLGSWRGKTSIRLTLNTPPSKGSCKISPTSGIEYQTVFIISCSGYKDRDIPIDYSYKAGDTVLDHSGNSTLSTRLFPTSGNICAITVSVCDDIGACVDVKLRATLTPLSPGGSWVNFLSQNGSNLKELIKNSDRSSANALVRSVIPHISAADSLQIVEHLVESLQSLHLNRLLITEQVLTAASLLYNAVDQTSRVTFLVSELFRKVTSGLSHSIRNQEIKELSVETHSQMISELSAAMVRSSAEVDKFPMVHDAENLVLLNTAHEYYPDYGNLTITDVVMMSDWQRGFLNMHKCLKVLGVVSAFVQLPNEAPIVIEQNGLISRTLVVDTAEQVSLSWRDPKTFISLPNQFLQSLKKQVVAIQVTVFNASPLWWYPEQFKPNTEIISVGVYSQDLKSVSPVTTKATFSYMMTIINSTSTENHFTINGSVERPFDMYIYKKVLPPNGVLVVTFGALDKDLNVLLTVDTKPRMFMFDEPTSRIVKASSTTTDLVLINPKSTQSMAYLAVTSASEINFNFSMVARLCLTWDTPSLDWTSKYCSIGHETNATHIQCSCWHLSVFAAKVHPALGTVLASRSSFTVLTVNWAIVLFTLFTAGLLIMLLCAAWYRDTLAVAGRVVLDSKIEGEHSHEYLISIYTNGHPNAGTSSNVTVQLHGSLAETPKYTLYSTPRHCLFRRYAQTCFTLFLEYSLGEVRSVSLQHDSFGRYPSWNVNAVKIQDKTSNKEYAFLVNEWLSDIEGTSCSASISLVMMDEIKSKWQLFKATVSDSFSNWYPQQAWCCPMLYETLTGMEKAAIIIVRVCITLVGILLTFKKTTIYNYEEDREVFASPLLCFWQLLGIGFGCHVVGSTIGLVMSYFFLRLKSQGESRERVLKVT